MIGVVYLDPPAWDISEALRYARADSKDSHIVELTRECMNEAAQALSYSVCYTVADIIRNGDEIILGNIRASSNTLKKALDGCGQALIFAVTVGAPFDRLIRKYSSSSPVKALMMQAIGAERAEALCDAFSREYTAANGVGLRPRVSPGYGDIDLKLQKDIFALLDCPRKIGLTLNASLIMSPSKSVTAIAGITAGSRAKCAEPSADKCSSCANSDCEYRR